MKTMKRMAALLVLTAAVWFASAALAQEVIVHVPQNCDAMTSTLTDLRSAPDEKADVLMCYYPGVRVEVVGEGDGDYVQVNVGDREGGMTGYMNRADLVFGEEAARRVRRVNVMYDVACRLYSRMDTGSEVRYAGFVPDSNAVLGFHGDWRHVSDARGRTGFINVADAEMGGEDLSYASYMYTRPLESEMSYEEVLALAKELILEDHRTGANLNMGMDDVTAEGLDTCDVEIEMYYYYGDEQPLFFAISFLAPSGDYHYAWINIWIKGKDMLRYNYGNG